MLRGFFDALVDIIYPKACLICKARLKGISCLDNLVCSGCWAKIKINLPPFCHRCGRHLEARNFSKNICRDCLRNELSFDRAFSPCVYEGVIKQLIHEFKYKDKDYLGETLSRPMIEFIKEYSLPMQYIDLVVPVPLSKTRLREREFNQAQLLISHILQKFNK